MRIMSVANPNSQLLPHLSNDLQRVCSNSGTHLAHNRTVYLCGEKVKMWYGKYLIYEKDRDGKELRRHRKCQHRSEGQHSEMEG